MKQSLDEYLMDVNSAPLLTKEEELALAEAIQQKGPDCEEKEQLIKSNRRFVISVANQYQKRGLSLEELIEIGNEGLVKAAEEYNLEADHKFISYAVWWIRQSILQALSEKE